MKKELIHSAPGKLINVNAMKCMFFGREWRKDTCVYGRMRNMLPHSRLQVLWSLLTKRHRIVVIEKVTQLGEVTLTGNYSSMNIMRRL